ncbi:DUF4430 domain-containing protein [Solibacillus sp. A46]|uniref:DUF4430 domain-containing protein n=1 Tax=Solibacillus faecavium TaxID=2762221 RepID=A0ABR8XXH4_9BACL|nr:DUF4430 domain-containing protein [Solibacillus faecavium]MBD8036648.1 DUF4430 domain-containing protein [Solibacillus faecavium]
MKKLIIFLLLTFLLTGCGVQSVEQYEQMQEEERSKEEIVQPIPSETKEETAEPIVEEVKSPKEQKEEVDGVVETTKTEEKQAPKPTEQKVVEQPVEQQPITQRPTEQKKADEKPVQQKPVQQKPVQPVEKPKRYATISIQVHSLLKHWDMLHPSLQSEQYVPASGFVLTPKKYELLSDNETVWKVLQRAVKEHGIHLEYEGANENVYNNVYIEGINHLYEFSAGPLSGWMYRVNGNFPNYGSSQYVLKDGDIVEWHYTVDLGRDLGVDGE